MVVLLGLVVLLGAFFQTGIFDKMEINGRPAREVLMILPIAAGLLIIVLTITGLI